MKIKELLSVAILAAISSNTLASDPVKVIPATRGLASEGGRFVLGQISEFRSDQYLLDTKTGRLWQIQVSKSYDQDGKVIPNGDYSVLSPVPYRGTNGKLELEPSSTDPSLKK